MRGHRAALWISAVAYGCSLLTYGVWLGAPLALAVAGFVRLRQTGDDRRAAWRGVLRSLWPQAVLALAALGANVMARHTAGEQWGAMVAWQPGDLVAVVLRTLATLGWFLLKIIWPLKLTPADDMWAGGNLALVPLLTGLGALVVVFFGGARLLRYRGAGPWLALLVFVAVELPVAGLTEVNFAVSDRYTYAGQLIIAAVLAGALIRLRPAGVRIALAGLACLTAAGAVRSWRQVRVWHDSDHLFRHVLAEVRHENIRQFYLDRWLGVRLAAGRIDEGEQELRGGVLPARSDRLTRLLGEARRVRADAELWGARTQSRRTLIMRSRGRHGIAATSGSRWRTWRERSPWRRATGRLGPTTPRHCGRRVTWRRPAGRPA